jgi:hypothetical protein
MALNSRIDLAVMRGALIAAFVVATFGAYAASPCDGVDHSLTIERSVALAPEIAKQLQVPDVDVLKSFRFRGWSIIYLSTLVLTKRTRHFCFTRVIR